MGIGVDEKEGRFHNAYSKTNPQAFWQEGNDFLMLVTSVFNFSSKNSIQSLLLEQVRKHMYPKMFEFYGITCQLFFVLAYFWTLKT